MTFDAQETHNLVKDIDYLLPPPVIERKGNLRFELDGMPITVAYTPDNDTHHFDILATIGNLPFTAESPEKRKTLLAILDQTKTLLNVKFGVDRQNRIVALGALDLQKVIAPDLIFFPLVLFLQTARPFIQLIGRHL